VPSEAAATGLRDAPNTEVAMRLFSRNSSDRVLGQGRTDARRSDTRLRPAPEALEGRQLLATIFVTNTSDGGTGSLRAALTLANSPSRPADTICFNIPDSGTHTIVPLTPLPAITHPGVIIDGYSSPGSARNTLEVGDNAKLNIVIDGRLAGVDASGLVLAGGSITVQGVVVENFRNSSPSSGLAAGILIQSDRNVVSGDFLGTDAPGSSTMTTLGNFNGIRVGRGQGNVIGGTTPADRNVISANYRNGIEIDGPSSATLVQNNYIGTERNGIAALGNGATPAFPKASYGIGSGIDIRGSSRNTIGGTTSKARNVVSGNGLQGVQVESGAADNQVLGITSAPTRAASRRSATGSTASGSIRQIGPRSGGRPRAPGISSRQIPRASTAFVRPGPSSRATMWARTSPAPGPRAWATEGTGCTWRSLRATRSAGRSSRRPT